jgi:hypothetical protein
VTGVQTCALPICIKEGIKERYMDKGYRYDCKIRDLNSKEAL